MRLASCVDDVDDVDDVDADDVDDAVDVDVDLVALLIAKFEK